MKRAFWYAIVMIASVLPVAAQTIKIPESWDKLAAKADEVTNLALDKNMLHLGAKFMHDDSADKDNVAVEKLLSKLNGIYVRDLEFKTEGKFTDADVEPIRAQLQSPEWSRMIDVNDKTAKEIVQIYLRQVNGQNVGIVILAEEPTELTFVHLDGPINFDDLGALGGNFGIPAGLDTVRHANTAGTKPKESLDTRK